MRKVNSKNSTERRVNKFIKRTTIWIGLLFFGSTLMAQKNMGKLAGKITDKSTNQTISGVSVTAKPSGKGTQTITDGTYILALPAGTYAVNYSSAGYQPKEIRDIQIKAGETVYLDVILDIASKQLENVTVTVSVRRETQSAIYSRQRTSSAVSDGISIEAIRKTPDNNAGQIMKRITGVNVQDNRFVVVRGLGDQYNQTMLNGVLMSSTESNRNAFALDLIPAAVIDNITVNKTATPDMPGNFAGGIVQINTKDFPANDFFTLEVGAGFSNQTLGKDFYSDKKNPWQWAGFGTANKKLPENFPLPSDRNGDISQLNPSEQQRYLRTLPNNIAPINQGPSPLNESFQMGFGKTIRFKGLSQLGIVFAVTQRKTELIEEEATVRDPQIDAGGTVIKPDISGVNYYSSNTRYRYYSNLGSVLNFAYSFGKNKITWKTLATQVYYNNFTERPDVYVSVDRYPGITGHAYGLTYYTEQKQILNSILAGEHRTGKDNETRIDWNINATRIATNTPDIRNFLFQGKRDSILVSNNAISTAAGALQQNSRIWAEENDKIFGGAFNVTTPFLVKERKQIFKAGLLYQNRLRQATSVIVTYTNLSDYLDSILAPSHFYNPGGASLSLFSGFAGSNGTYNAGSSLLAAYESIENRVGNNLRIIWGIRAEEYQQYVNVYDPIYYPGFRNYDLHLNAIAARTTFNFLPSVNMVYALSDKMNLRAAYSNTVVRPELKDLAEFPRYDYQTFIISKGNPELKSTSINNYDFKFEYFPSAGEILSFAAFYKKLFNPIEYARFPSTELTEGVVSPLNAGNAHVQGIEVEIRKKIDFISSMPALRNVTIFGNGSLLSSQVDSQTLNSIYYPKISEHTLTGQPPYIINAGINISAFKNTFDASLTYNRTGDYIYQLGSSDKTFLLSDGQLTLFTPNTRVSPRNQLDLVVSQALMKNRLKLRLSVNNLLGEAVVYYQDINNNGKLDDRVTLNLHAPDIRAGYLSGVDNTTSDISGQVNFFFYVSYTF